MNRVFFAAFSDELSKIAGKAPASALSTYGPHIASAAAGAGLLLGGQRLYKDVQMGEKQREAMKQQKLQQAQMGEM